jgi:hypothetical protein
VTGQIQIPLGEERVSVACQKSAPDVLSEDAAVLVLLYEVLLQSGGELVATRVGADSHYAVPAVRRFSLFEQDIDAVTRNPFPTEREAQTLTGIEPAV